MLALLQALQEKNSSGSGSSVSDAAMSLLESSTPSWQNVLHRSVGFGRRVDRSDEEDEEDDVEGFAAQVRRLNAQVAPTLQAAMARPCNQFAILIKGRHHCIKNNGEVDDDDVVWHFPTDPLDYGDGICWVEARLRTARDDELLVVTGWSLVRRRDKDDDNDQKNQSKLSPWLLEGLDWQDFRETFRPGVGREEWEQICG